MIRLTTVLLTLGVSVATATTALAQNGCRACRISDEDHSALNALLLWCDRTVTSVRDGAFLQLWGSLMAALIFYAQQTGMA